MAAAATLEDAICLHEPTRWLDRWDDIFRTVWHQRRDCRFIGIADHGLGFHLPEILRRAAPRTLIIDRPIAEVNASLTRIGLPATNFCDLLAEALDYDHPLIRRVPYADLTDTNTVVSCLEWLMPGASIDHKRTGWLQDSNIQADIDETLRIATTRASEIGKFIPRQVIDRLMVAA